jgi:hypothetical protein
MVLTTPDGTRISELVVAFTRGQKLGPGKKQVFKNVFINIYRTAVDNSFLAAAGHVRNKFVPLEQ